jgi:4-hydroxy-tetrahydrodipicolinate synthase
MSNLIKSFKGAISALVTPFKNGKIDESGFQKLIEFQIDRGIHGVIPVGTTGESPTINLTEHWRLFELAVEAAAGRVPVIAGCGSNDTINAIAHMKTAQRLRCDGALVVAPYYNKPNQAGLIAHYEAIANSADLPIMIYNIPGRTGVDILPTTIAHLSMHKNIVALKDSAGDPSRTSLHLTSCKAGFRVFAGDDNLALGFAAYGTSGVVSVLSNIVPDLVALMQNHLEQGDFVAARTINTRLDALQRALFIEPNPVPVKYVLAQMGLISPDVRLPLVELSAASKKTLDDGMKAAGL